MPSARCDAVTAFYSLILIASGPPLVGMVPTRVAAQPASRPREVDHAGAKPPEVKLTIRRAEQYKRIHQLALRYLLRNDLQQADQVLDEFSTDNDPETLFLRGLIATRRDDIDEGVRQLHAATEAGLPPQRLLVGPRNLVASLANTPYLRDVRREFASEPVHGPLIGHTTDTSVTIWCRTVSDSTVTVVIHDIESGELVSQATARATANRDFTAVVSARGLTPDTEFRYALQIDDGPTRTNRFWRFRTFPRSGEGTRFSLVFGGGAGYVPDNERVWRTIAQCRPNLLLLLGDNVYIDDPESKEMQQYTYYRRQSRPEWRELTAGTPTYTIWDDHDFSVNDSWGGPEVTRPWWKHQLSWPIFQQNWANPIYGGGENNPGCWYRFRVANVDFFMLDCRYYRTDPRQASRSMLGPVQLAWLKDSLLTSDARYKVLCSSVPWDFRTKGDSLDTWNGYREERIDVFNFLTVHDIKGVVLLSADRHRSDAWRIDREGDYPLYEFNSSRLTNQHVHKRTVDLGALFSYNASQSFGRVQFDTRNASTASVRYDVISIDGEIVHTLQVPLPQ